MGEEAKNGQAVQASAEDMRRQRLQKLERLRSAGVEPYGHRVRGLVSADEVKARFLALPEGGGEAPECTVAGRLMARRVMGRSLFANVKDQRGNIQLYLQRPEIGDEAYAAFKDLDLGDIVAATGRPFRTRTGEVSLHVASFELLSKAIRPMPEKFHGLTDTEQRYRQRYLDLISNDQVRRTFELRSRIIREIRRFLDDRGFLEVETPMMQTLAGGAAARPFKTHYNALNTTMYLRIATELFLKRLVVGGFEKVYEIGRNFRNEGMDRRHNPEFTAIEIYEAYSDCRGMMELIEELVVTVAERTVGTLQIRAAGGNLVDLKRPWRVVPYRDLIRGKMGPDWFELPLDEQVSRARELNLYISDGMDSLHVTHEIYEKTIEETLVQPTFVTRLPAFLVPLARRCPDDPALVDVYELEINGQELSPGYSELNDPREQRSRFDAQLVDHGEQEGEVDRIDEDFLTALEYGMPPTGGLGMGIDRLVMLLTGAESIRDVVLFPQMRPLK